MRDYVEFEVVGRKHILPFLMVKKRFTSLAFLHQWGENSHWEVIRSDYYTTFG